MSIIDEVNRIKNNISNVYTTLANKGIDVPTDRNSDNLSVISKGVISRVPINCAGLTFWLDGDCNTRNGVNRSKNYFENLVWNQPYSTGIRGNQEVNTQAYNNKWIDNYLHIVNGGGFFPQQKCTSTNEYTVEVVARITSIFPNDDPQVVIAFGSGNVGSFHVYMDKYQAGYHFYVYFKGVNSGTGSSFYVPNVSFQVGQNIYVYFRIQANSSDCGYPNVNKYYSVQDRPEGHKAIFNTGFANSTSTGTSISSDLRGNIAIGMVRFWARALTDNEIQANYQDAKMRFNCL